MPFKRCVCDAQQLNSGNALADSSKEWSVLFRLTRLAAVLTFSARDNRFDDDDLSANYFPAYFRTAGRVKKIACTVGSFRAKLRQR